MARLEQLPGTKPDRRVRNLAVAAGYLVVIVGVLLAGVTYGGLGDSGFGPGAADGDTESDSVDGQNDPAADDDEEALTEGEIVILFETTLERRDIDLTAAERDGDVFRVEYYRTATTEAEFLENAGAISGAYVGAVGEGLETEQMEVTARDESDDSPVLSWHVDSEWAEAYHAGELTMDEVIVRSLATADELDASDAEEATDGDAETEPEDDPETENEERDDTEEPIDGNETAGLDGETDDSDAEAADGDAETEYDDANAADGGRTAEDGD